MDITMSQELVSIDQDPLLLVFLELRKVYDTLDRRFLLKTLEGYRSGPKLHGILVEFWESQWVVTRKRGYPGPQFWENRSTTQGVLELPALFNLEV